MYEDIRTWFFDCDGVILDSNAAKTEAFRMVATPYGGEAAEALVPVLFVELAFVGAAPGC